MYEQGKGDTWIGGEIRRQTRDSDPCILLMSSITCLGGMVDLCPKCTEQPGKHVITAGMQSEF